MTVGGDQAHRVRPQHELRAVQEIPRVFAGDRKLRLRDHLLQRCTRQRRASRSPPASGRRREILARQRLHPRIESIRRHLHAALVFARCGCRFPAAHLTISYSFLAGSVSDSALSDRRLAFAAQRDLEIGREQAHLVALGFHQHVGEDRNRVLAFDDALKKLQFSQKVVLADDEFHSCADLEKVVSRGRESLKGGEISRMR